jgi:hypothetical protein
MVVNRFELSIADWLWEVWNDDPSAFSVPFKEGNWEEIKDLDDDGLHVVVKTGSWALVYRNNGQVPSKEEITSPLPNDYFTGDGDWDDEMILNKLNQFATLVEIYRI